MRITSILVNSFAVILLMIAIAESNTSASTPPAAWSRRALPLVSHDAETAIGRSHDLMSLGSLNARDQEKRPLRAVGHVLNLTHRKVNPDAPDANTIPHWSDSFTYNGLVYNYTMVGTDPKRGSATTVIPTVLIPIRFVFADGNVFDATTDLVNGQTPIQGIINSPLFQNYDFNSNAGIYVGDGGSTGLVRVGNTQYGDAFQRANFWDSVSTRSPNYHVLLGQPTVLPVQIINVPYGLFSYYIDPVLGPQPIVDQQFLFNLVNPILTTANTSPGTLPIIVSGEVTGDIAFAFHGVTSLNGNGIQTFIETCYYPGSFLQFPGVSGFSDQDVYPFSHEILEWINDPFLNNFTPGWDIPFLSPPNVRCDSGTRDLLEVGDVVEYFFDSDITLPAPSYGYHVTEGAFIDFFTRESRSRSYNGQYSFFEIGLPYGLVTPPSAQCTGHLELTPTYVDFPGSTFTVVTGINIPGLAVGFYDDTAGTQHGFTFDGSNYSTLDYPGSLLTDAFKINNAGTIVGAFVDASGGTHGFSYQSGQWRQIDFPGASDTEAYGINAAGDIVGVYDEYQPVTHAFLLRNGQYQRIDTPFGTQANAFAINDVGSITGLSYTDPYYGPFTSFVLSHNNFSSFQFPGSIFSQLSSINNSNDLAGIFVDPDGTSWGMVTIFGHPYQVFAGLWGNDELNRIFGYTFDETGRPRGLIGALPLQGSRQ
jgi:probable HAF family extracellular repeat protein